MSTSHLDFVYEHKGLAEAYNVACDTIRRLERELADQWESRFFERRVLEDGRKKLVPVTEGYVSRAYDTQEWPLHQGTCKCRNTPPSSPRCWPSSPWLLSALG